MAPNSLKTRFKKFIQYLSLGSFITLVTVLLGLSGYPTIAGMARVSATLEEG